MRYCFECHSESAQKRMGTVSESIAWVVPKDWVVPVFAHRTASSMKAVLPVLLSRFLSLIRERNSGAVGLILWARVISQQYRVLHAPYIASFFTQVEQHPSLGATGLVSSSTSEEEMAINNSMSLTVSDAEEWACSGEEPEALSLFQSTWSSLDSELIRELSMTVEYLCLK